MADASRKEIIHHKSATIGNYRERLTAVFIEELPTTAAAYIKSAGIYETGDPGCGSFDTLLVVLEESARGNPQAVIQAIKDMRWIYDKDKAIPDIGMLQFSRLS